MQFIVVSVAQGRKRRVKILQRKDVEVEEEVNENTSKHLSSSLESQWLIEM